MTTALHLARIRIAKWRIFDKKIVKTCSANTIIMRNRNGCVTWTQSNWTLSAKWPTDFYFLLFLLSNLPLPLYLFLHHRTEILFTIIHEIRSGANRVTDTSVYDVLSIAEKNKKICIEIVHMRAEEKGGNKRKTLVFFFHVRSNFLRFFPISVYNLIFPFACLTFAHILSHTYFQFIFRSFPSIFCTDQWIWCVKDDDIFWRGSEDIEEKQWNEMYEMNNGHNAQKLKTCNM